MRDCEGSVAIWQGARTQFCLMAGREQMDETRQLSERSSLTIAHCE